MLRALSDPSWRVRKEAVHLAGRWPDVPAVAEALLEVVLESQDAVARNAAVESLAMIGAEAVGVLARACASGHPRRKLCIDALGLIGDASATATLLSALEDPDENTRMAAAEALGRAGGQGAADALVARLGREGVLVTAAVLEALWKLERPVPTQPVLNLVRDAQLRRLAVRLLGLAASPPPIKPVVEALADEALGVRQAAVQAADRLYQRSAAETRAELVLQVRSMDSGQVGRVAETLQSADASVRCAAVAVLGWTASPEVCEPLCRVLADDLCADAAVDALCAVGQVVVPRLRQLAGSLDGPGRKALFGVVVRLGSIPAESAAALEPLLVSDLRSPDEDLAQAAAAALEVTGGPAAIEPLVEVMIKPGQDDALVQAAAAALGGLGLRYRDEVTSAVCGLGEALPREALGPVVARMGGGEFLPLVRETLNDPDAHARVSAVRALSGLGGGAEARVLAESALLDFDPGVRAAAALLLGNLAGPQAHAAVDRALGDPDAQVRSAAARAVGRMGSAESSPRLQALVLTDDSPAVAVEALEALRELGTAIPADVLAAALDHDDSEVVKAALRCAAQTEGQSVDLDKVEAALRHDSWDVRLEAVRAFSRRAPVQRVRRALSALLETEADGLVQQVAREHLEQVREDGRP